jgi:DNA-binding MltR family transcriptional regulator
MRGKLYGPLAVLDIALKLVLQFGVLAEQLLEQVE